MMLHPLPLIHLFSSRQFHIHGSYFSEMSRRGGVKAISQMRSYRVLNRLLFKELNIIYTFNKAAVESIVDYI